MSYPVAACRGHWTAAGGAATPWYLSGGISAANCIAAYQPKGAVSLAASYVNLANPGTYNAAPGSAPGWDATNGWTFVAASSQWLTTGYTSSNTQSKGFIARFSNFSAGSGTTVAGWLDSTAGRWDLADFGTKPLYGNGGWKNGSAWTGTISGVYAVSGSVGYVNGSQDATGITWAAGTQRILIMGARNRWNTGQDQYATVNIQAFSIYDIDIASYVAALTTAMAAL